MAADKPPPSRREARLQWGKAGKMPTPVHRDTPHRQGQADETMPIGPTPPATDVMPVDRAGPESIGYRTPRYGPGLYGAGPYGSGPAPYGHLSPEEIDAAGNVTGGVDQTGNTVPPQIAEGMPIRPTVVVEARGAEVEFVVPPDPPSTIQGDHANILLMARLYERMARDRIDQLDGDRPNEPELIARNARERELLTILADGFARISLALEALSKDPNQPVFLGQAKVAVNSLSNHFAAWFEANGKEAADWLVRVPVFAAGLSLLGWVGADMSYATAAIGAIVGGPPVADALTRGRKPKAKKC